MNQYQHKPMGYGVKLRKLLASQFYLNQEDTDQAREYLESGALRTERELINFIDNNGEWLDS